MSEKLGIVAAVICQSDAAVLRFFGFNKLGHRLSYLSDHIDIHMVEAHGHSASKTCGPELQRRVKAALYLLVVSFQVLEFEPLLIRNRGGIEPLLIFFDI
jgi:hypothetical protein